MIFMDNTKDEAAKRIKTIQDAMEVPLLSFAASSLTKSINNS